MTLSEFKAWFEGYTEGLEAAPTKAQFDRIKEKVKEISGTPVTYHTYYHDYYRPYWGHQITTGGYAQTLGVSNNLSGSFAQANLKTVQGFASNNFDGHAAMYALGKAEAAN